jgi:hypothetical protein
MIPNTYSSHSPSSSPEIVSNNFEAQRPTVVLTAQQRLTPRNGTKYSNIVLIVSIETCYNDERHT